jgi:NDP-sugar pyrophosphorylase family protein
MEGAALVARELSDTGRFGRLEEKEGCLVRFSEKASGGPGWINAGIYRIPSLWLEEVREGVAASMETDLFPAWLREGREIAVLKESGAFLDIGTPESLAMADDFMHRQGANA